MAALFSTLPRPLPRTHSQLHCYDLLPGNEVVSSQSPTWKNPSTIPPQLRSPPVICI